jgi:hypothetical protein
VGVGVEHAETSTCETAFPEKSLLALWGVADVVRRWVGHLLHTGRSTYDYGHEKAHVIPCAPASPPYAFALHIATTNSNSRENRSGC